MNNPVNHSTPTHPSTFPKAREVLGVPAVPPPHGPGDEPLTPAANPRAVAILAGARARALVQLVGPFAIPPTPKGELRSTHDEFAFTSKLIQIDFVKRQAPGPSTCAPESEAELNQLNADYVAAFNDGNAQALAALFTEDPVVMNTVGTIVSGRLALMAALEHSFAGPCQGATLRITPQQSTRVSGDVIVQQGTTRTTLKTDPPTYHDFNYTKVFVRRGNLWKMAVAQFSDVQPTPRKSS